MNTHGVSVRENTHTIRHPKRVIFCLTSARSGTTYVSHLIKHNLSGVKSKHEPFPDMFGHCIYWHLKGERYKIRRLFALKKWRIDQSAARVYIETNHAFLKSFMDVAIEAYPDMKLLHIIRDPMAVARSETNRLIEGDQHRIPLRHYWSPFGKRLFRFALTGEEPIFTDCALRAITSFQFHILQWIEIENRAVRFLDQYQKHADCLTIDSPDDFNKAENVEKILHFVGGTRVSRDIILKGRHNRNVNPTKISNQDQDQFAEVLQALPTRYLDIFHQAPYRQFAWANALRMQHTTDPAPASGVT